MDTTDFARVVAEFGSGAALLVEPGSAPAAHVPTRWSRIAAGRDAADRCAATTALWQVDGLTEMLPRFGLVLAECLEDVRICLLRGDWVLLYALRKPFQPAEFRIGWDPETFGRDQPAYWYALPDPLRGFLARIHAGFTDLDGVSYGPIRPRDMLAYSELGLPASIRNWQAAEDIPGDRAMLLAQGLGGTRYFVSPDLPPGTIGWEAEGQLDRPLDFPETLDELMSYGFQLRAELPPRPLTTDVSLELLEVERAVAWNPELTEHVARERIRTLIADLLHALGGQLRLCTRGDDNGENVLPCGDTDELDRLEARYLLEPPAPDAPGLWAPLIAKFWEQHDWPITISGDTRGVHITACTPDWFELTLSYQTQTLHLRLTSPGFTRT
ncbi:hypothetical protein [Nocardia sp. NPDC051832]|uniref:hypothetical protein n=1 Tax=Nocardia sp. NPDC051832 TaxID=3155673 RepID=UPI00343346C1